mmetsp:Transcript_20465/g.62306  ORF Transcript_20465/g.62306 Transcript_20465/m.62306 type:complete len:99 (+) Transcript_20465:327-623(+)
MSSACFPCSTMRPPSTTQMMSQFSMVVRRWAIMIVVRPVSLMSLSSASCTTFSDSLSSADVASSRSRTLGLCTSARAIATRCFWPPLRRSPPFPMSVS